MPEPDPTAGEPIALPRHPPEPPKAGFPLLAVLAPLVGAAVLFAIVRSPYMLAFAALSPVIALASSVDARISARRRRRADARTHAAAVTGFLHDVAAAHDRERRERNERHPTAASLMTDPVHRPRRWAEGFERFAPVRIATGGAGSTLAVAGSAASAGDRELLAEARTIDHAPIVVDPASGIGLIGVRPVARAALRGLVVQLAHAHPPGVLAITAPPGEAYDWLDDYPHGAQPQHERLMLRIHDDAADGDDEAAVPGGGTASVSWRTQLSPSAAVPAVLAVAERVDDLPTGCRLVAMVEADGRLVVLAPTEAAGEFRAELVTAQAATAFGRELATSARSRGADLGRPLPAAVGFADLPSPDAVPDASGAGLRAVVGKATSGPLELDLVTSGPHAIVTGTTGSGKSELLITWVLAMASRTAPERVNFLLVDFKGGTAFQRLAALPHTVGVVTDLAHGEAARALKSLRAELRRREAELARQGSSDIVETDGRLPRLVIVVDEAAAMLTTFPELGELFADLAARGRALGVHLILGTQRATGVLGDALIANCGLRVSLRLASHSDSTSLLGTDAAARLPHGTPGRLVVARDGELMLAQAATAHSADVDAVVQAHRSAVPQRAPWLPALPHRIPLTAFGTPPEGSVVIGARDDPDRQTQEGIVYRPAKAHLLVLGVRGSGKSTVIETIRAQWNGHTIVVPPDIEGAWDALASAESILHMESSRPDGEQGRLVLIDEVDGLLGRFGDEHRDAVIERIRTLMTDGPRAGIGVVCTAAALPSGLRGMHGLFGERLLLRQSDKQEHVLAGGPADLYEPSAPPGRGVWRERAAQVALAVEHDDARREQASRPEPPVLSFPAGSITLVVARAPGAVARRLRTAVPEIEVVDLADQGAAHGTDLGAITVTKGGRAIALVADPDAWQSQWPLLARLRPKASLVCDGCTLAQVRATMHSRVLPPATERHHVLVCDPAQEFVRARMPG